MAGLVLGRPRSCKTGPRSNCSTVPFPPSAPSALSARPRDGPDGLMPVSVPVSVSVLIRRMSLTMMISAPR